MRNARAGFILAGMFLFTVAGCTDQPQPAEPDLSIQAAVSPGDCGLVKDLVKDVKSVFPMPAGRAENTLASDLDKACKNGDVDGVRGHAIALLAAIEAGLEAGSIGGTTATRSGLANALLACTQGLCNQNDLPNPAIDFTKAFGEAGTFAVRHDASAAPVVARDWVEFEDENPPGANWALWGIDVDAAWSEVAKADPVLIYGGPASSLVTQDPGIGGLQYDFKRWPVTGQFDDDKLHVWVCFADDAALPHGPGPVEPLGRMQREGVLLSDYEPTCPEYPSRYPAVEPQNASVFAPVMKLVRGVLPRNLFAFALRTDTRTPHVGGSALDFSVFAPVAADTEGYLTWVVDPPPIVVAGEPISPTMKVAAFSGSGTPMEKVKVIIEVDKNSGVPAGAFVSDSAAFTLETDGIASFPQAAVNKPGGYTVCATGQLAGFTFERKCSTVFFHARSK
jgi:hypothetical protein